VRIGNSGCAVRTASYVGRIMGMWLELAIIVGLALLNGFFALAEIAIVSSRRTRLHQMAEAGNAGAVRALALAEDPGRFLSSVQVGITLIGILSGAFGGATLGFRLGAVFEDWPLLTPHGQEIAFVIVVVAITALSVIVGELVPKRIALSNPEPLAARIARPLEIVALIFRPFVWFLGRSSDALLAMLGVRKSEGQAMTEEEIKIAISEGTSTGVIDEVEEEMIHGVLELADRSVASIMTPRPDVYWVDLDDDDETIARDVAECPYSRIVVARDGDMSRPLGVVQKRDLVEDLVRGERINLERRLREPADVPEGIPAMRMLQIFRTTPVHIAFVFDEYGDFQGLVTLTDIMSAIAGELPEEHKQPAQELLKRDDGSWLVDGRAAIEEVKETLGLRMETNGDFHTAAGLALERMARIPEEGEHFEVDGWRVEIIDMVGNRIDKLLFIPPEQVPKSEEAPAK
ncbi:MAG TPA: hemolysin family protein, partial [Xanthobacteraceae bacterium]|nr:hemolysin family protein [Xanthobacteraceae bacterium]